MRPSTRLLYINSTSPIGDLSTLTGISGATLYEEISWRNCPSLGPRKYLALLQTDAKGPLGTCSQEGDVDMKQYNLVQDWNPRESQDVPAPQILTVGLDPQDMAAMHKWHVEEHLGIVSSLPGYRRSFRYELEGSEKELPGSAKEDGEEEAKIFVVHEVESVDETFSEDAERKGRTEWAKRIMSESKMVFGRGWKLVDEVAF